MQLRLDGQIAIITGSSMGIGKAVARVLGQAGARVVINSRDSGRAAATAQELEAEGITAWPVAADLSRPSEIPALFSAVDEHWGALDILVNNAGTSMVAPSETLALEDWQRTIDLDLTGAFLCAQQAARRMIPRRSGAIINMSSILGATAIPYRAAYAACKHGLNGLTKVLAVEWAQHGLRVYSINPSYIATAMGGEEHSVGGYSEADIARRTPVGRFGTADEVANVALFLASDASSFMTGSSVDVDGGWLAYGGW